LTSSPKSSADPVNRVDPSPLRLQKNGMMSHRSPRGTFERRRLCRPIAVAPP